MKILNNKKGSAMLWCVLLTIILTILLSSVLTASYAYFNYTMTSIRKQQAYFTARSALSTVLEEFSQSDETHVTTAGSSIYTYNSSIALMPGEGETITISKFDGLDSSLGTATGTINLNANDKEKVDVSVTAVYQEEEYTMKATIAREPLYFGGIAVKNLILGDGSTFTLGENTDLYYYTYRNKELLGTNTANVFDTTSKGLGINGSRIVINGNLITQGDAKIGKSTIVAGHKFNADTSFTSALHPKKIWNSSQYIITNKTLTIKENSGKYSTSLGNVLDAIGNMTLTYCNNSRKTMNNGYYFKGETLKIEREAKFGTPLSLFDEATTAVIKAFDKVFTSSSGKKGPLTSLYSDNSINSLAVKGSSSDGLAVKYIQILSTATSIQTLKSDIIKYIQEEMKSKTLAWLAGKAVDNVVTQAISDLANEYMMTVMDISYIQFDANNLSTYGDSVYPVTYLFIEGNNTQGIYCRIKYGQKPDAESSLFQLINRIDTSIDKVASNWFNVIKESSFVVVYLGENSTLELGTQDPYIHNKETDNPFTKANQTYFYTIYGSTGSKVILNGKNDTNVPLTLIGGIQCDDVEVRGNVNVIYSSTNGSQVAKQKVGDFWTVVNYKEG